MSACVYVVFSVFNRKDFSLDCLHALARQSYSNIRTVIFDDGSTDGSSAEIPARFPEVIYLKGPGDYWWSRSMNAALREVLKLAKSGDFVLTLNNDTDFDSRFVERLVETSLKMNRSVVGSLAKNFYDKDRIEDCGTQIRWNPYRFEQIAYDSSQQIVGPLDALACRGTLVPVEVIKKIGFFASRCMPQYLADIDFFIRARKAGFSLFMDYGAIIFEKEMPGSKSKKFAEGIRGRISRLISIRSDTYVLAHICFICRHGPGILSKFSNLVRLILGRAYRIFYPA